MFLNLMAFEHLHVGAGCEVSSYIWFMDNLIDTKKDVELLRSKGIIENGMGSDEEVALLFNKLSKEVTMEQRGPFARLQKELSDHCKRRSNRYCAEFHQSYLSSPWAILSLLAAVFLLMLTVAQTVYSGLSYHNPH
ncbi:hypothetical protein AMTR_s00016p00254890 [Amborella trichopoda]|nr:hypothetical protein AMTR_s00016p00254890 [Amborella trichopoda]